jgi:hypothetical protein
MSSSRLLRRRRISLVHFLAVVPTLALCGLAIGACGDDASFHVLPVFEGGPGIANASEAGDATSTADGADATASDGEVKDTSTNDSSTNDGGVTATNLVISQVQSRNTNGGDGEFIEIYNPTAASITFDSTWSVTDRNATSGLGSCAGAASTLYTGTGKAIASHGHLLIATATYADSPGADDAFSAGISDAASIVLVHSSATVDALCFSYDGPTTTTLTTCSTPYICEGAPATNPHNNTTGTNNDSTLERKPGAAGGNATDTNVNANDFQTNAAADPHDLASAAVP